VVLSDASKKISKHVVRLAQTMHLSYTDTNTVSKLKEETFHMTHDTKEFHRVHQKWIPSLWYIWRKLCTYLASRLTLFPNVLRFHMNLVTSEYHRMCPKWFLSRWYIWCNLCTYLALTLTLSSNGKKWDSTWPMSPRSSNGWVQNDFGAYGSFNANRAPILH
jgi:hypothetical protein